MDQLSALTFPTEEFDFERAYQVASGECGDGGESRLLKVFFIARELGGKGTWHMMNEDMVRALSKLRIDLHVITEGHLKACLPEVKIHRVSRTYVPGSLIHALLFKFKSVVCFLREGGGDIIDAPHHLADALPFVLIRLLTGKPRIVLRSYSQLDGETIQLFLGRAYVSSFDYILARVRFGIIWALANFTAYFADVLTVESHFVYRMTRRLSHPAIVVNQLGITMDRFKPIRNESVIGALGLLKAKYILTVAGLEPRKGVQCLFDALPSILGKNRELKAVIVGSERLHGFKTQLVRRVAPALRERVILIDHLDLSELAELYSNCMVYVSPSLYESYGYTVVEALACGAPVVASATGVSVEIGLSPPLGEVVKADSSYQIARAVNGTVWTSSPDAIMKRRAAVEKSFSIDEWVKRTVGVYQLAIRKSPQSNDPHSAVASGGMNAS